MTDDLLRLERLRFAYLCGKLSPDDMAWMEHMLHAHPELQATCDDERRLIALSRAGLDEMLTAAPPLVSFESIATALAATSRPWWGARLAAALTRAWQQPMPTSWAASAVAMLAVVVGVQTVRLQQVDPDSPSAYRSVSPGGASAPGVTAIFADTLTLGELRALAASMKCEIVGGPDEQGRVRLRPVEGNTPARLVTALKANPHVLDAHETSGQR